MAESEDQEPSIEALPIRKKQQRQQLTKGMEHMRSYVTISDPDPTPSASNGDLGEDAYGVPATYEPIRKQSSNERKDNPEKRSDPFQFGTRYLTSDDDIFAFNAWDHVTVDPSYNEFISTQTAFQRENQVSDFDKHRFNSQPEKWWDKFYSNNATNFFKDRKWLVQEFPVLGEVTKEGYEDVTVLEVGAGAGNTAFPLLAMNRNHGLRVVACDYSRKAVELVRAQEAYTSQQQPAVLRAEVWDVASDALPPGLGVGSVDLVLMIFIFSALSPEQWQQAVKNVWDVLKPGGEVLFRDYGRGDLAQVRFKKGRYLEENFYVRGDGTRVYFFEQEELRRIWAGEVDPSIDSGAQTSSGVAGEHGIETQLDRFDVSITSTSTQGMGPRRTERKFDGQTEAASVEDAAPGHTEERNQEEAESGNASGHEKKCEASFDIVGLATDRRMLVNRQRKLKMYRCWLQGRFRKPAGADATAPVEPWLDQNSTKG